MSWISCIIAANAEFKPQLTMTGEGKYLKLNGTAQIRWISMKAIPFWRGNQSTNQLMKSICRLIEINCRVLARMEFRKPNLNNFRLYFRQSIKPKAIRSTIRDCFCCLFDWLRRKLKPSRKYYYNSMLKVISWNKLNQFIEWNKITLLYWNGIKLEGQLDGNEAAIKFVWNALAVAAKFSNSFHFRKWN